MKVPPNTKLDPADLTPYAPGAKGKAAVAQRPKFDLSAAAPPKPGMSGNQLPSQSTKVGSADLAPFLAGHPGKATKAPFKLEDARQPLAASATTSSSSAAGKSQHDQLIDKTQKWVSQTFFGTLLKQMSDSPFKSELFSGGRGGEAFSSLYHQQLADRMAHAAGTKLVKAIVKKIEANQAKQKDSGFKIEGPEKKSEGRPLNTQDPRTKAYMRSRPSPARQSTFSLAA